MRCVISLAVVSGKTSHGVLPELTKAVCNEQSYQWPAIFDWLQQQGNVTRHEMYRTFNCGVGMIVVVSQDNLAPALQFLQDAGETAWHLGEIQTATASEAQVIIPGVNA